MGVDVNYWLVGLLLLVVAFVGYWFIKRNRKDEMDFEKTIIQSEIKPEKKNDGEGKNLTV